MSINHKGLPNRVKNEIARKLREYGTVDDRHHAEEPNFENFPQSWLDGRGSSANEPKIYDKDRDYGDTNFRKKDSGQDDLDEGISDLIGNQYKFSVGSGTTMNQEPNTKEYVIKQITHAISHYLFDWEFYYNWTDRTEQKEYGDTYKNDILKPLLKNLDKTLKTYFIVDIDKKTVKWKLSYDVCEKIIDEFFRKNKHISKKLKQDYYEYRDEYAGVKLKENSKEDKNGFVDNATSSQAWLLGREGRKFQKATYDKAGTYDGENFVSKNSGQPDLDEDATFQLKQFGTLIPPDVMADMNKSKSIKSDLIKTLNDFYKRNHINRKITETTGNRTLDTIRAKQLANALDKLADKITATKKVPFEQVIFKLEDLLQDNKYKRTNMKMVNPQLAFAEYSNGDNTIKMTIKNQSQISVEVIK